jgi:CBS-domain-containing membrane protein
MARLPGRLGSLTADDVMTRSTICLSQSDSVSSAVETLRKNHITGAPVVDAKHKLVGILSLSDLVFSATGSKQDVRGPRALEHAHEPGTWDLFERAQPLDRQRGQELVREHMSRDVASVVSTAPLVEVARVMCDGHWHRVPVVDDAGALCGIISTMDVLAALVNAADESA